MDFGHITYLNVSLTWVFYDAMFETKIWESLVFKRNPELYTFTGEQIPSNEWFCDVNLNFVSEEQAPF